MNLTTLTLADRDIRQRELVPPEKLAACYAIVIGVGAIGRQVAVQLAAVGISSMDLIDPDTVGVENLAPQAYWPEDIGVQKVVATAALCRRMNPMCHIEEFPEPFRRSSAKTLKMLQGGTGVRPVVFACVDRIETRQLIWNSVRSKAAMFIDGRMNAEVLRVLASQHPGRDDYYPTTLFAPEQTHTGACTARSTVYTASIAAGLMLSAFTRWLRGLPVARDVMLNLLASELIVQGSEGVR